MRFYIDKKNKNFVETLYNTFKINGPDDIYFAVGKIIQQGQEWENAFRKLCGAYNLKIGDLEKSTLNKMSGLLFKKKYLNKDEYEQLKGIINLRNIINHKYFLDKDWSFPYDEVQETLNSIYYLICDGIDYIDNKLDELDETHYHSKRPTVIEKKIRSRK